MGERAGFSRVSNELVESFCGFITDDIEPSDVEVTHDGGDYIEVQWEGEEWLVATDAAAQELAEDEIWESAWATTPKFLETHVPGGRVVAEAMAKAVERLGENANPAIQALIEADSGKEYFCEDVITEDGRGHILARYDGEELDADGIFFYRVN